MKNNREYRLIVRLTHDEGKAVAEAAQAANLSMSDLVRSLLFEQPKVKHSVMLNAKKNSTLYIGRQAEGYNLKAIRQ